MKIAVSVESDSITSPLSDYFGRCQYFALYDTETNQVEFINNEYRFFTEHAGTEAMKHLHQLGITRIVSANFGEKALAEADRFSIQLIIPGDKSLTLKKWIGKFGKQKLNRN